MFGLTVASLIYVLFVLPVAIADYAISTEWYGSKCFDIGVTACKQQLLDHI